MVRYRLAQNFGQKITLRLNDESDYSSILGNVRGTKPSDILGRGLINLGSIYEFQTASIAPVEGLNDLIRKTCDDLRAASAFKAKAVPILPEKVTFNYVREAFNGLSSLPIGIDKKNLEVTTVNFIKGFVTLLTSLDVTILGPILNEISKEVNMLNEVRFIAIDPEGLLKPEQLNRCEYVDGNLDEAFTKLHEEIKSVQEAYSAANFDKNAIAKVPTTVIIISGFDKFTTKLSPDNKKIYGKLFELAKELDKYCFILVDSVDKFKKVEYDDWYRSVVNNSRGIWIGDGIANQFSIKLTKTTKDLYDEIGNKFGYVVERGVPVLIKLLEEGNGEE
jgi:S-DNA-T family DNA segregation ATPase FtsK/SpoIIIE